MTKKDAFDLIVDQASPFIILSYVIDEQGKVLLQFGIHPQMNDHQLTVNFMDQEEVMLTSNDVRNLATELIKFADCADVVVKSYLKNYDNKSHIRPN
jgi:hypothetical protein